MIKRIALLICLIIGISLSAHAQGVAVSGQAIVNTPTSVSGIPGNSVLQAVPGAQITVCQFTGGGIPCSPLVTIFSDPALTVVTSNPFTADANGNFQFWIAPGNYLYSQTGSGIVGQLFKISAGVGTGTVNVPLNLTNSTPATNCVNQPAPGLNFNSNYWNGSASTLDTWRLGVTFNACPNGTSTFSIGNTNTNTNINLTAKQINLFGYAATSANPLLCWNGFTSGQACIQVQAAAGSPPPLALPVSGPTGSFPNCLTGSGGSPTATAWQANCTSSAASTSQFTTKVVYAADPQWAGGAKANGHLFIATITGNVLSALKEMDGATAYNPLASGVKNGDYVACVDVFGKNSQTATLEMGDGTVNGVTSTTITSTTTGTNNTGMNCYTGTDDTAALAAAFNATLVYPCGTLVLPAGHMIISSNPFINSVNAQCATKIIGQSAGITAGGVCCQLSRDYGSVFNPTNGFNFSNAFFSIVVADTSNSHGELQHFVLDALGIPFTNGGNGKNGIALSSNYTHDVAVYGLWPAAGTTHAFNSNTSGEIVTNIGAQGDSIAISVGGSNQSWSNVQAGNNGQNWDIGGVNDILISGGFEDEESNVTMALTNSQFVRMSNVTMLGATGGADIGITIDGTSSLWMDQCQVEIQSIAGGVAVSIAAGGKLTAQSSTFGTGNSTTNASITNNGTFFDNGQNLCTTFSGAANNSGGTVPGSCQSNASIGKTIASLTHSITNFVEGTVNLAASTIGTWTPDQNINVTRIQVANTAGNTTCATPPVLSLSNGTTTQTLTLTSGQSTWDTGVIFKQFISGTAITLTQTAAAACATPPVNLNVSILWQAGSGT